MPKQILVVDDEAGLRNAWVRALRYGGYVVKGAATAEQALQFCQEESFDLVLLDFLMPAMSGVELLVRIRKEQPLIRSIIVSGQLSTEVDEQAIKDEIRSSVEADAYLHKPISNERLRKMVSNLLDRHDVGDWKEIAEQVSQAKRSRLRSAKKTTQLLRRHKIGKRKR